MAFDGNGTFNRPESDYVFDTVIDETKVNNDLNQIATGLSNCVTRDGQSTVSANLPMNSKKHTGVAVGTVRTEYADIASVQDGVYMWGGTAGGTVDAITFAVAPAITAYKNGQRFLVVAAGANTGAMTSNTNSVGVIAIKKRGGTALVAGDVYGAGHIMELVHDGADLELLNPSARGTVQVVNTIVSAVATGTTTTPIDDTIPQNTEGDEFMTLAITPTDTNNKLLIQVNAIMASSATTGHFHMALFQDSTAGALASVLTNNRAADNVEIANMQHFMTAGTTSATTFKIRIGNNLAGTTTFNGNSSGTRIHGGVLNSFINITEVKP